MMFTDLPQELEWEILSRVPATYLTQFRSTCRRWYALFKDPIFIKNNSGKAARQVILKTDCRVYSVNINLHGINNSFDPSIEFTGKDSEQVLIYQIFQCDGLLLCTTLDSRLVVWNPCTGQTRWIRPENPWAMKNMYALGYEDNNKSCRSYKILRSCLHYDEVVDFEIYDFNSDSWKVIDYEFTRLRFTRRPGISLKGKVYWVWGKESSTKKFLLRFDFKREKFKRLSLPTQCSDVYGDDNVFLSVVRDEKLYVLLERFNSLVSLKKKVWVWVTDSKIDKARGTNVKYSLVVVFTEIWTPKMLYVESFLVDEDNKKVVCCCTDFPNNQKTEIYIVGGDKKVHVCKQVRGEIARGPADNWPLLVSYVPSLVQIQQVEANAICD